MNRRGFLGGLIAAIVAPAVITTPGLLMPISTLALPTYGPDGVLTPAMIAAEFNRRLQNQVPLTIIPGTEWHEQANVDMNVSRQDLRLSLEDFTDRYLAPAAQVMANHINHRGGALSVGRIIGMPYACLAAIDDRNGVCARMVYAHDIFSDRMMMRLDVLHS